MITKTLEPVIISFISSYDFVNPENKQRLAGTQCSILNPNPKNVNSVSIKFNLHPDLITKLNLTDEKERPKYYGRPVLITTDDQPTFVNNQQYFKKNIINIEFVQQK